MYIFYISDYLINHHASLIVVFVYTVLKIKDKNKNKNKSLDVLFNYGE